MARVGVNAETGQLIYGWSHCVQSMREILETEIGLRVQRRTFGSELTRMIDRPQNIETIIDIYSAVAEALEPRVVEGRQYGEPGFVLLRTSLDASEPGHVILSLGGVFFENGHLGDYSNPTEQTLSFAITDTGSGITVEVMQ
ncbi:hypothetical protein J2045_003338 [Peteryoungia aggregata LMG 23059]|uniref:Baseplate assembly protein n=1 Tax=Peteryoungia aggregata LMG 23059 TaxID=1368425 RepID=A0ABU0GCC7_9HYPH|nr:baseplate assembly protein [Peteryoungia aggregata]MDQ0422290.1 hypothetical protein [Peteryoungia aggregata LMG 23059]